MIAIHWFYLETFTCKLKSRFKEKSFMSNGDIFVQYTAEVLHVLEVN